MNILKNIFWGSTKEEKNISLITIVVVIVIGMFYTIFIDKAIMVPTIFSLLVSYCILRGIILGIGRKSKYYKTTPLEELKKDLEIKKFFQYLSILQKVGYGLGLIMFVGGFYAVIISISHYFSTHPIIISTLASNLTNEAKLNAKLSAYGTWITFSGFGLALLIYIESMVENNIKERISELEKELTDKKISKIENGINDILHALTTNHVDRKNPTFKQNKKRR